jgi:hypothetical protein
MKRRDRSEIHRASGKLISAIQKVWVEEDGEAHAIAEAVMYRAQDLGRACSDPDLGTALSAARRVLGEQSVVEYLGAVWVEMHPVVVPAVLALQESLVAAGCNTKAK